MASEASPFACDSRMTSRGNRSFRSKVVSIQAQAVKLHKNFFTLSIVCELTRKTFWVNIFVLKAKYVKLFTLRMKKLVSKLLVSRQLRIETTSNPSRDSPNCRACLQARGEVTRDNSKPQFLAQQSVAMLKQCCNHSKQYRNNVATLYCAKNRRCELSRVT